MIECCRQAAAVAGSSEEEVMVKITRETHSAKELYALSRRTKDLVHAIRLRAVAMVLEGFRRDDTARVQGVERATLAGWVRRYNAGGPQGLVSRPKGGSACRLDEGQLAAVKGWVEDGPDLERDGVTRWRVADIAARIEREFGVRYTVEGVRRLLRRLGFRHVSARPLHPKADTEQQAALREEFAQRVEEAVQQGSGADLEGAEREAAQEEADFLPFVKAELGAERQVLERGECRPAGARAERGAGPRPGGVPSGGGRGAAGAVEEGAAGEHGTGHREQAVGDRAQGAGMPVPAGAQGPVAGLGNRLVLGGSAGPVEGGLLQARAGGLAAPDDARLAGAPGDRGDPAQAAQGAAVPPGQRVACLGQQGGEHDAAHARQGAQDLDIAGFGPGALRRGQPVQQLVGAALRRPQLVAHQRQPRAEALDLQGGPGVGAGGPRHGPAAQAAQHLGGADAADAVALEQPGHAGGAQAPGILGHRRHAPQREHPGVGPVGIDRQQLGVAGP